MENSAFVKCEPGCLSDTEEDKFEAKVEILSENFLDIKTEPYSLFPGAAIKEETSKSKKGNILRKLLIKEGEINEHEARVKQEIKQETRDPSQAADKQKLQSDSSNECTAENESLENGEGDDEEETEQEQEPSASDERAPLESMRMKYCCRQSMVLGKDCDICNTPMVKYCCRQNMLLGKNCNICKKSTDDQNLILFSKEQELSACDEQAPLDSMRMKYCCRQSMVLGKDCDICNTPMVKDCCRQNMLLGKNCDICKKPTDSQNLLYKCEICDFRYTNRYRLQTHLIVHRDKNFQCDVCLKFYLNQRNLDKHKQSMHCGERKCFCPTCGKGFKGKFALKRHIIIHSDKRVYHCFLCNKSFKMKEHLVNHKQLVHCSERNCLCPTCGKGFKTNFVLRRHLVSHSS